MTSDKSKHVKRRVECTFPGCGKTFYRRDLNRHKLNHTSLSFVCDICHKSFKRQDVLTGHKRRHVASQSERVSALDVAGADELVITGGETTQDQVPDARSTEASAGRGGLLDRRSREGQGGLPLQNTASDSLRNGLFPLYGRNEASDSAQSLTCASALTGDVRVASAASLTSNARAAVVSSSRMEKPYTQAESDALFPSSARTEADTTLPPASLFRSPPLSHLSLLGSSSEAPLSTPAPPFNYSLDILSYLDIPSASEDQEVPGLNEQDWDTYFAAMTGLDNDIYSNNSLAMHFEIGLGADNVLPRSNLMALAPGQDASTRIAETRLAALVASFYEEPLFEQEQLFKTPAHFSRAVRYYWDIFHPQCPILHRPTFNLDSAPLFLVAIMALIGNYQERLATGMPPMSPTLARLSLLIRARLLLQLAPDMPINMYQSLILCQFFDEFMSTTTAHFAAQCFSSTLISIARRKALMVMNDDDYQLNARGLAEEACQRNDTALLNDAWLRWIRRESMARVAYVFGQLDSQLPTNWSQVCSRRQTAFSSHLPIPCSSEQWEATSAMDWSLILPKERSNDHIPSTNEKKYLPSLNMTYLPSPAKSGFSESLRLILIRREREIPGVEDAWTRLQLLYGISMIVFDIRVRGVSGFPLKGHFTKDWKDEIHLAIMHLSLLPFAPQTNPLSYRLYYDSMVVNIISLYIDIVSLHVFTGSARIHGCPVGPTHRTEAHKNLIKAFDEESGRIPLWYSAKYLEDLYNGNLSMKSTIASSWTVYVATLTCWAFSVVGVERTTKPQRPPKEDEYLQGALTFLSSITKRRITDPIYELDHQYHLVAACRMSIQQESPGWEIMSDASCILLSLLPNLLESS